jgi:tetratricopeptide (TPR) repeat protein
VPLVNVGGSPPFYQRAVSLDSTFAGAWARLARAQMSLYANGVPDPTLAERARQAADRARRLAPTEPDTYQAWGDYYSYVNPTDYARSLEEYEHGLRITPDNVELLGSAALAAQALGRWDSVITRLTRAAERDPRSALTWRRLALMKTFRRDYAGADSAIDHGLLLSPSSPRMVLQKVIAALGRGNLPAAQSAVRTAATRIEATALLPYMATYQDLYWVLDDDQQRQVMKMGVGDFDGDPGNWGIVQAEISHLPGDPARTMAYADTALLAFEEQLRAAPDDAQRHAFVGLSLAYLGRKPDAVREGLRAVELAPVSRDAYIGPYLQLQLVRIYLLVGEPDKALDGLEAILGLPYYVSRAWLRVDPTFDPLRSNLRFRKLVEGTA